MLTELGHGLDAANIETTATLREDGSFDLHTPNPNAAKSVHSSGLCAHRAEDVNSDSCHLRFRLVVSLGWGS